MYGQTKGEIFMKRYYKIAIAMSILIIIGFILMPESKEKSVTTAKVSASTTFERINYFALHGWEVEELFSKDIIIPSEFSDSYEVFAQIQDKQKLPLRKFMGEEGTLYTYSVKNYTPDNKNLLGELIVCDNIAVSSIIYAEDDATYMISVQ